MSQREDDFVPTFNYDGKPMVSLEDYRTLLSKLDQCEADKAQLQFALERSETAYTKLESRLGAGERLVQRACGLLSRLPEEVKLVGDRGQWVQDAADWLCVVETAPPTNSGPNSSELVVERQATK